MSLNNYLDKFDSKIKNLLDRDIEIENRDRIPRDNSGFFIDSPKWLKIEKICVVFTDMVNSSQIDFSSHTKMSARIYEVFTSSLVRIMKHFDSAYIDIQGDGVLAIFDGHNSYAKGFLAATTFRTLVKRYLSKNVERKTNNRVTIATRSGLSYGDIIVKRIGDRNDNKPVWAYQRVNQAVKLASIAEPNSFVVSSSAYEKLGRIEWIEYSCGCKEGEYLGEKSRLWQKVSDDRLSKHINMIKEAYELKTVWCPNHGDQFIRNIVRDCNLDMPSLRAKSMLLNWGFNLNDE